MLRRFWASKAMAPLQQKSNTSLSAVTDEILFDRKAAADINIKHNLAVQRFARPPYDLKTKIACITHAQGYMATLEWRWNDPSRDGKTVVAVTSGINTNRKLAISDACRAMLTKQKLIEKTDSAKTEAVKEVEEFINGGHSAHACKALLQSMIHSGVKLESVSGMFSRLWRKVVSLHDARMVEVLLSVLEKSEGVSPAMFESLLQEVVFVSNQAFAESVLLSLSSDRIRVLQPERGLVAGVKNPSELSDVKKWKFWRSLIAIEELATIHSSLKDKEQLVSARVILESASLPLIKLRALKKVFLLPDSLVLLSVPGDPAICLTGKVREATTRPDGAFSITVSLITEETNDLLLKEIEIDLTVLSESRVTFERVADCLREFYKTSSVPDLSHRFADSMRRLLLPNDDSDQKTILPKMVSISPPPDLSREKRFMNLSEAQLLAVINAVSHPLSLIHGPAGTGKTHTLCGIVSAWRSMSDSKILCCADSNTAADNIYSSLKRKGFEVFRFGTWKAVSDVPEEVLAVLPNKSLVEKYRSGSGNPGHVIGLRKQVEEEALKHFKIIVTTLSSSRNPSLDKVVFPNVIIDESAQTTEPAALLAISHGCERLVLVGDHKQLPAVVLSKEAQRLGLDKSLFERLILAKGSAVPNVLLNVQRRMHPSIAEWPSKTFYENQLETHPSLHASDSSQVSVPFPFAIAGSSKRVVLIDTDGSGGGEELVGTSTLNYGESKVLIRVVNRLIDSGIAPNQIGVIVPYLAQKGLISKALQKSIAPGLLVNTVEGFQGQERDFIVISTTRSNVVGSIGFLNDERRMNVMLTRAKQGLIVVGDKHTLGKHRINNGKWADWIAYCEKNGSAIHHRLV